MALRSDVAEAVRAVSRPKSRRPVVIVRRAEDNGPTPERARKLDYEPDARGKRSARRPTDNLGVLERGGKISGEAVSAAGRWLRDWNFGYEGIVEFDPNSTDYVRGDVHTFAIAQGRARERISLVREAIGETAHRWLVFTLAYRINFSAMARDLWPEVSQATQCERAQRDAAEAISLLPEAMAQAWRTQKEAPEKKAGAAR